MIADCETCERRQLPCSACEVSQRTICFICQGDVADPYGEIPHPDMDFVIATAREYVKRNEVRYGDAVAYSDKGLMVKNLLELIDRSEGFPGYRTGLTYGDGYKAGLLAGASCSLTEGQRR